MSTETSSPGPGAPFPRKTALAVAVAVASLLAWHLLRHHPGGLDPAIFPDAAILHLPHPPRPSTPTVPTATPTATQPASRPSTAPPPISPVLLDDSRALDPFFAALWPLEDHPAPGDVVTILHYGDSPTTADLITGDARAMLQHRFGDAGHGFNLVGKPWAWYGHRDVDITDHGWRSLTGVGSMRQSVYGLGGATLVGGPDARSTFRLRNAPQATAELQYLTEPNGGAVTLSANDITLATIPTDGPVDTPTTTRIPLPPGTTTIQLAVTGSQVKVLGIDLRTGRSGVLYDSLGLNGASTTVISRTFAPGPWTEELQHAAPSLVIINYGTNESSFGAFVHKQYEGELRLAIAKLRAALPDVPILIMSPMDRGERAGLNDIHTMATIPEIVAIQRRVADDTHCAFFDTFNAMGGDGTFARWFAARPRLVTADFIHPTPQGALLVAQLLVQNLTLGYDRWKQLHGLTGAPSSATPQSSQARTPSIPPAGNSTRALPGVSPGTTTPPARPAKPSAAVPEPAPPTTAPANPDAPPAIPSEPKSSPGASKDTDPR